MQVVCIGIYGETCAGKSTVGKHLSLMFSCPYISFGDIKRDHITRKTDIGIAIETYLWEGHSIPPALGFAVIEDRMSNGLQFISGYPISTEELEILSRRCCMLGIINLTIDESTLVQRFEQRRECPICHLPGIKGEVCPLHHAEMVRRTDATIEEQLTRRMLYRTRIAPFLQTQSIAILPRLDCDTSSLARVEVIDRCETWTRQLLQQQRKTHGPNRHEACVAYQDDRHL